MVAAVDCYIKKPTTQSIEFAGRYINLTAISRSAELDHSYLSRIFSGARTPSLAYVIKISQALNLGLDEFVDALNKRVDSLHSPQIRHRKAS